MHTWARAFGPSLVVQTHTPPIHIHAYFYDIFVGERVISPLSYGEEKTTAAVGSIDKMNESLKQRHQPENKFGAAVHKYRIILLKSFSLSCRAILSFHAAALRCRQHHYCISGKRNQNTIYLLFHHRVCCCCCRSHFTMILIDKHACTVPAYISLL